MRSFLAAAAVILAAAAACTPSVPAGLMTIKQPGPGETPHIERLVVWLSGDGANFDKDNLEHAFRNQLGPRGIQVAVGLNPAYQYGLNDAERALVTQFRATHRLDIKVVMTEELPGVDIKPTDVLRKGGVEATVVAVVANAATGDKRSTMVALYAGQDATPVWEASLMAFGRIGGTAQTAAEFVNELVRAWQKSRVL